MIVLENLLEDIENRRKKVDERLERTSLVGWLLNLFKTSIEEEANMHSCRLEQNFGKDYLKNGTYINEDFDKWYATLKKNGQLEDVDAAVDLAGTMDKEHQGDEETIRMKEMKKAFKECYGNLNNAWKWGLSNLKQDFDEQFIIEIAKRIEPGIVDNYRKSWVRPTGAPVTPPAPKKVPGEMKKLMINIEKANEYIDEGKMNPTELAIMTHYHLARIHPFEDGNGRTSRLIQNLMLHKYGYPATIIHKGEKTHYVQHLRKADEEHRFREVNDNFLRNISEGEKDFYNYLASRINTSIDLILDKAYKK